MHDYQKLAPILNSLKKHSNASLYYDLFADALVWGDEVPSPDLCNETLVSPELRGIWHYRTSLILGQPKEKFRLAWEEAQRCFPDWPGFDSQRQDNALAATFLTMQEAAMKKWEEAEDRINAQLADKQKSIA